MLIPPLICLSYTSSPKRMNNIVIIYRDTLSPTLRGLKRVQNVFKTCCTNTRFEHTKKHVQKHLVLMCKSCVNINVYKMCIRSINMVLQAILQTTPAPNHAPNYTSNQTLYHKGVWHAIDREGGRKGGKQGGRCLA